MEYTLLQDAAYEAYRRYQVNKGNALMFRKDIFFTLSLHKDYLKDANVILRREKIEKIKNKT